MSTPSKNDSSAPFVFTPIGSSASKSSASSNPFGTPTQFATFNFNSPPPTTATANPAVNAVTPSGVPLFNFDAPPSGSVVNSPLFSIGASPSKSATSVDPNDEPSSGRGARNPFASEVTKRRTNTTQHEEEAGDGEDGEDGEEEEEGEDENDEDEDEDGEEDDGPQMDEDDEGDTPYPIHEKSANTVQCELCDEWIPKKELATHQTRVCSETPMECPFVDLHCGATAVNRRLLRAHVERNLGDHMVWIFAQLEEQRRSIQLLTENLMVETTRRQALERTISEMGGKVDYSNIDRRPQGRNGGGNHSSKRGGGGGGRNSFSPSPASASPVNTSSRSGHEDLPKFTISFDATKPLEKSSNRWVPHSIPIGDATPSKTMFPSPSPPKTLVGTGNSASEEQTRLKIAAGLLPPSALTTPNKPPPSSSAVSGSPTTTATPGVDDLPALTKQLKSLMNKLSAPNFDKLSVEVIDLLKTVQTEQTLATLVSMIFDKAVLDVFFANLYAKLCAEVSNHLPPLGGDTKLTFKRFLLTQCQIEFESGSGDLTKKEDESEIDYNERKKKQKQRMLGTIRFIGELYRKDLILHNIMTFCILHLLPNLSWSPPPPVDLDGDTGVNDADDGPSRAELEQADAIEALCKLLTTIGPKFEQNERGKATFDDEVFPKIHQATQQKSMPSRLRFMLLDLYELRANQHWQTKSQQPQQAAQEAKVVTTVEMGLGNHGVSVVGSSGRGAVHATNEPPPPSSQSRSFTSPTQTRQGHGHGHGHGHGQGSAPSARHIHHDDHSQNSMFQQYSSNQRSGSNRKASSHANSRDRDRDHHDRDDRSRGRAGGNRHDGNNGQWVRGDLLHSGGNSGGGGRAGGNRR